MSKLGFAVVHMALAKSTVIRRAAIHHLVSDAICSGLTPVAGVDEVVCSVMPNPLVILPSSLHLGRSFN